MKCAYFENRFSDYIDGELDHEERDALRFHLSGCEHCRIKIEDMERTVQAVRGLASVHPGPQFDQVLRNLLEQERVREVYRQPVWTRLHGAMGGVMLFTRSRSVALAIAASLIVTIGLANALFVNRNTPALSVAMLDYFVPSPVEPTPAPWGIITPKSIEPELAPMVLLYDVGLSVQRLELQNIAMVVVGNNSERPVKPASRAKSILTIQTLEPKHTGISSGAAFEPDEQFFVAGGSRSSQSIGNAFTVGPVGSRNGISLSPTRVTRISF